MAFCCIESRAFTGPKPPPPECKTSGTVDAAQNTGKTLRVDLYLKNEKIGHARTEDNGTYFAGYYLKAVPKSETFILVAKVSDIDDKVLESKPLQKLVRDRSDCIDTLDF